MNTHPALDALHLLHTNSNITESLNTKSVVKATLLMLTGGALLCLSNFVDDKTSGLYLATVILPFVLFTIALIFLLFKRKKLVYAPNNSLIICGYLYFDKSQIDNIKSMLKADSAENIEWTGFQKNGNARLHYMVSQDAQFAAVQLDEYIPYFFETVTEIFYFEDHHVHPIAQLLLQSHPTR